MNDQDDITRLSNNIPLDDFEPEITEIGEVDYIGDGICRITGLPNARMEDIVRIEAKGEDVLGLILGLNENYVETVILGDFSKISKGDVVSSAKKRIKIPSGEEVFGRVIDPLGKAIDGNGELKSRKMVQIENPAPMVNEREQIVDQIRTGILVVDSIIPVGKGQRELVIGDRKSGKTTLVQNIIINQKGKGIFCIYVSVLGKKAMLKGIYETLLKEGCMDYTVIIAATSDDLPSMSYIAPYSGCAIAESLMKQGKDALVIYDDLSKHAKAYRQMSLLLKRSPGRDAYPGDIFYLHSRLLERSAKLSKELGGGSSTAFPMAETQSGDISEFITTNLMSITDGHIYLDVNLMHEGILPAVDSGFSVSRIGGSIQTKLLRKLGEMASKSLQRYNEVKSFENINTEISEETERELKRGKRVLEIFNQPSSLNMSLAEEVLSLFIVCAGLYDDIELIDVRKIKIEVINFLRHEDNVTLRDKLSSGDTSYDELEGEIKQMFSKEFLMSLLKSDEPVDSTNNKTEDIQNISEKTNNTDTSEPIKEENKDEPNK